jgi:hypothetical protein
MQHDACDKWDTRIVYLPHSRTRNIRCCFHLRNWCPTQRHECIGQISSAIRYRNSDAFSKRCLVRHIRVYIREFPYESPSHMRANTIC